MNFIEEGDSGLLVQWAPSSDPQVVFRGAAMQRRIYLNRPRWLREAIPGTCSLCLVYDPLAASAEDARKLIESLGDVADNPGESAIVEIPVVYGGADGPDLERVAGHAGIEPGELARRHAGARYRVAFLGFAPGFAYMAGLPTELVSPRLKSPRPRVPPGSVAVGGAHTAVYPNETAGGWNLIGRTSTRMVDWTRPDPFLLHPGDRVAFRAVERHESDFPSVESIALPHPDPSLELRVAGLMTTIQDLGRGGSAHLGVPVSGAMDRIALRLANLAAGNLETEPALEFTFPAPRIRFLRPTSFVLGGADFVPTLADRPVPFYERVDAAAGEDLVFARRRAGHWAYLALAGGISTRKYLGSAATDTRSGIGRRLSIGSKIGLDHPPPTDGRMVPKGLAPMPSTDPVVRFVAGATPEANRLDGAVITLSPLQDRSGYRTESPVFSPGEASLMSEGLPPGTIQLPVDGKPIFLMADRPTTGGYPKLGFFASIDTRVIAQCPPGTRIRFEKIIAARARELIREARQVLNMISED